METQIKVKITQKLVNLLETKKLEDKNRFFKIRSTFI